MATAALSMTAAAQTTFLAIDNATLDLPKDMTGGTELAHNDNVSILLAYDESVKSSGINVSLGEGQPNIFSSIKIGDCDWTIEGGITGNANPKEETLSTAPVSGFVIRIDVKEDCWITVPTKMNTNKSYAVWEGSTSMVAYTIGGSDGTNANTFYYTLPADDMGYINFSSPEIGKYFSLNEDGSAKKLLKPLEVVSGLENKNLQGFLQFKAYKDAGTYYVNAYGSKISVAGVFISPAEAQPAVVMTGAESGLSASFGEDSGVNDITIGEPVLDENAPIYNVQGMRVNKDAKGILIQNGKKFVRF